MSTIEDRLAALEAALLREEGERVGADLRIMHRIRRVEELCLNPAVQREIQKRVPWPLRWLGLGQRLGPHFWERSRYRSPSQSARRTAP